MTVETKRLPVRPVRRLASPEDAGRPRIEDLFRDELVDRASRLEGRVELDDRLRPKQAGLQLFVDALRDPFVADDDEAASEVRVVADEALPKLEDLYGVASIGTISGEAPRMWAKSSSIPDAQR
jgi:hypothetical protein